MSYDSFDTIFGFYVKNGFGWYPCMFGKDTPRAHKKSLGLLRVLEKPCNQAYCLLEGHTRCFQACHQAQHPSCMQTHMFACWHPPIRWLACVVWAYMCLLVAFTWGFTSF